jgi:hypothetical protein
MTGVLMAATFSWGCQRANQLGITPLLKEYALSEGKSASEEKIREELKKLYSYFYYCVIAFSNGIKDPFDLKVVKAHWVGNELLESVTIDNIKYVFNEMKDDYGDRVILAVVARPLVKTLSAHHNSYAKHNPFCSVTAQGNELFHLGVARITASLEDLENLEKYGKA